jgi:hypothetical protein
MFFSDRGCVELFQLLREQGQRMSLEAVRFMAGA